MSGRIWFQSFLKRNPSISLRIAENLTISRAAVSVANLKDWFSGIHNYLKDEKQLDVLKDPARIFNADETAFFLNSKGNKILATKEDKKVYQMVNADDKECLTELITGNADGILSPPLIVFNYDRIPNEIASGIPSSWGVGKSESGWMNGALF